MSSHRRVDRRMFLSRAGRMGVGLVVVATVGACSTDAATEVSDADPSGADSSTGTATSRSDGPSPAASEAAAIDWHRVDFGFVSAYLLVSGDRVVVVDTGTEGGAEDIEQALADLGLGWYAVTDVVLTHRHPDHIGSLEAVMEATGGRALAGEADIIGIGGTTDIVALRDGDEVAGLQIVATPGHTPGHISVYDPVGRVLVAGDALVGRADGGGIAGPDAAYTQDMDAAHASVRRLAELDVDTVLFGHGEPVEEDADRQLSELADRL